MEIIDSGINYKNADNCKQCPKRNDEDGCQWWWEWVETNGTGQERLRKQCGKSAMQVFMVEVIKASNRPAAAVESTRNEIVKGFERLSNIAMANISMQEGFTLSQQKTGKLTAIIKKMLGKGG